MEFTLIKHLHKKVSFINQLNEKKKKKLKFIKKNNQLSTE